MKSILLALSLAATCHAQLDSGLYQFTYGGTQYTYSDEASGINGRPTFLSPAFRFDGTYQNPAPDSSQFELENYHNAGYWWYQWSYPGWQSGFSTENGSPYGPDYGTPSGSEAWLSIEGVGLYGYNPTPPAEPTLTERVRTVVTTGGNAYIAVLLLVVTAFGAWLLYDRLQRATSTL